MKRCWLEKMCLHLLPEPPSASVIAKKLPPTLRFQLDNCAKDNKNRYVFAYWLLLVVKGIFKEVFISFLLVGHTHDDIDGSFGRWSMKLREEDFPTIPLLMKSYMNLNYSRHPPYDRGGVRLQGIYRTLYLKWSSPIDRVYEGIIIPLLNV